jgi:hypothetical protein
VANYNRVYVTTSTAGTGSVTTGSAVSNQFLSFLTANAGSAIPDSTTVRYLIEEGTDFEIGNGTYTSGSLARTTVLISRISGTVGTTKMTLAGAATVRIVLEASDVISASATAAQSVASAFSVTDTTQSSSTGTGALKTSGGLGVAKNAYVGGNINITGTIQATAKAQLIGAAGGTIATGALASSDSNVILYDNGTGNWAGYGADNNGNFWLRVGYSGTAAAPFYLDAVSSGDAYFTKALRSSGATSGVGYATGAGGAVTQATSRTTGVTLNTVCGAITLVSAAGSTTIQAFTVTNSAVAATDTVVVSQKSGTDKYRLYVTAVAAGSFQISYATLSGTTTEQPVFNFSVLKAVTS